jgi:hypothetical protein
VFYTYLPANSSQRLKGRQSGKGLSPPTSEKPALNWASLRAWSKRFPADFMFQLSKEEFDILRCQFGTSNRWGGRRYPPYAFTEQGVAMLSSVMNSQRAIKVNIIIMRAFVRLREMASAHKELARKLEDLEKKYDKQFLVVFEAIRQMMLPSGRAKKTRKIGFVAKDSDNIKIW